MLTQQLKGLRPFSGVALGLSSVHSGGVYAALQAHQEILRITRTPTDLSAGIARFSKVLDQLNAGVLANLAGNSLRFPPIETPALEIQEIARQGWLIDPLLLIAEDDVLPFLEAEPSEWTKHDVADALQRIMVKHEAELLALVKEHVDFLLATDRAAANSHLAAFEAALRAVCQGVGVELVTQAMLARTEGLFNRAFRARGVAKSKVEQHLYSTQVERAKNRRELLEDALERAYQRREAQPEWQAAAEAVPYWREVSFGHYRLGVACEAFSQGKHAGDEEVMAFGTARARNHAQHDGVGTESVDWAVRAVLWFSGMAVVLGSILEPIANQIDEGVIDLSV